MNIASVTSYLEEIAPLSYQESYDNAGLIVGNKKTEVQGILISLDVTEAVVDEAILLGANLIVAHHPVVFSGIKKFNGSNYVERTIIKAIKHDIAIYAAHTNLDSVIFNGVNSMICKRLGLKNTRILEPVQRKLLKLVVFVPETHAENVRSVMFKNGAGQIGAYDSCSFNLSGTGTFKAGENTSPFVGKKHELHQEAEIRIELIVPPHKLSAVLAAMKLEHPYEEVAYDVYQIENEWEQVGAGMIGELDQEMDEIEFLKMVKTQINTSCVKYTNLRNKPVKKVAVCGGSGSFLLKRAIRANADVFITGDIKYHQFFDAEDKLIIADVGHFESEQYTKDLFYELLIRKFSNFAIHLTKVNTNPIKYL